MRTYYTRPIDCGCGRQNVVVDDGIIVRQTLEARSGYYTGDGNPEWVGCPKTVLRGKGFRKRPGIQVFDGWRWRTVQEREYAY